MNPRSGWSDHWFFGNGMLHSVELRDGRADLPQPVRADPLPGTGHGRDGGHWPTSSYSPANTHIVQHAGSLLALEEAHLPWQVERRPVDRGPGRLRRPPRHPDDRPSQDLPGDRRDAVLRLPDVERAVAHLPPRRCSRDDLLASEPIEIPKPVMMHDFNITRTRTVFMDLPITFSLEQGGFAWDPGQRRPPRGDAPRRSGTDVRWFEIDPCYVFHPVNSYDDGERIVLHVARFADAMVGGMLGDSERASRGSPPSLWRWTIDPATGTVSEDQLDDRHARLLPGRRPARRDSRPATATCSSSATGPEQSYGNELYRYDLESGGCDVHDLGATSHGGEAVFVPRHADAAEDDGWLVLIAHDESEDRSRFVVIDSQDFTGGPVAEVLLPRRVPYGAHGNWFADTFA